MPRPKQTHCKKGHALILENIYVTGDKRQCKLCQRKSSLEYQKRRRELDPEGERNRRKLWRDSHPGVDRKYDLKRRYGLSLEDFDLLLEEQNFCCVICSKQLDKNNVCVDHNHLTTEVRGLLCRNCNIGIGHLQDNYEIVLSAARYLIQSEVKVTHELQGIKKKSD